MALDWLLDKARPREGREAEYEALLAQWQRLPKGHPDREALRPKLEDVSIEVWDVIGCPRVGRDEEADRWLEDQWRQIQNLSEGDPVPPHLKAYCGRPFDQVLSEHANHPIIGLAKDQKGFSPVRQVMLGPLDYPGQIIGACKHLPDSLRREAYESHGASDCVEFAGRLEQAATDIEEDEVRWMIEAAAEWLRYWGGRGFGFMAWF